LTHPHICTLHDVGEHEGNQFIVMELVQGQTLATPLVAARNGLPLDEALTIAAHVHARVPRLKDRFAPALAGRLQNARPGWS
jgi:hypothetical protein